MFVRDEDNHLQSEYAAMASTKSSINVLAQSMWGLRVIQFGEVHAYELQEYRDENHGGPGWFIITGSPLRSYVFKKFHTLSYRLGNEERSKISLDDNPAPVV